MEIQTWLEGIATYINYYSTYQVFLIRLEIQTWLEGIATLLIDYLMYQHKLNVGNTDLIRRDCDFFFKFFWFFHCFTSVGNTDLIRRDCDIIYSFAFYFHKFFLLEIQTWLEGIATILIFPPLPLTLNTCWKYRPD